MLNITEEYLDLFKTPSRQLEGSVGYSNGTIQNLVNFKIERTSPGGKFFGFAVAQKITIESLGPVENIQKGDKLIPTVGIREANDNVELPNFYLDTIEYSKVENKTTITGYDIIGHNQNILIKDIDFVFPMALGEYAETITTHIGATMTFEGYNFSVEEAPNLDGTENIQTVLGAIAEASGAICYVNSGDNIRFRVLKLNIADTITPANYFDFTFGETTTLTEIASATELGDNDVYGAEGYTQVIRENPFNIDLVQIGGLVIGLENSVYEMNGRGCPAYELGDRLAIREKDGTLRLVYLLNETLTYNGGLSSISNWATGESERVDGAPPTISKLVGKTYAKVDKMNREISLVVEETEDLKTELSSLKLESDKLVAQVELSTEKAENALATSTNGIAVLTKQVQAMMTSDEVSIAIQQELANGVGSVKTTTGFTFDEDGLTIDKSGSEMTTQITEDGMEVFKNETSVLVANNIGVEAINLNATTYLTINNLSRFENYKNENDARRTGCFWLD